MSDYFKFPSTKHIILPEEEKIRADKVMSSDEIAEMLAHEIVIEEKIDGANLGISFDNDGRLCMQNRGNWLNPPLKGQWKKLEEWMSRKESILFDILTNKYILFGEWCYAVHSVYYNKLPDYFIGFDIYDKEAFKFLSTDRRNELLEYMEIAIIHPYAVGKYSVEGLTSFFGKSYYGDRTCEGIYIRWDEDGWLKKRAKLVRYEFRQSMGEHWDKGGWKVNQLNTGV